MRPFRVNGKQIHVVIGGDTRLVRPFKVNGKQIHAVIGADARAVRPYIQLN